jgi:hypothetical protein
VCSSAKPPASPARNDAGVEPAELERIVGAALEPRFRRFAQHRVVSERGIAALLELQRSDDSRLFYVNLAFDLGGEPVPPSHRCAFRFRTPQHPALDLDIPLPEAERREQLERLVTSVWAPFLQSGLDPAGLRRRAYPVPGLVAIAGRDALAARRGK